MESYDLNGIVYLCPSSLDLSIVTGFMLSVFSVVFVLVLFYLIDLLLALVFLLMC